MADLEQHEQWRKERGERLIAQLPPMQRLILDVDVAVTGIPAYRCAEQYHHQPKTVEEWLIQPGGNPLWYLSDGGYSRIVWSTGGEVFLTDNSTSKAKANWGAAQPQVTALQDYLNAEYKRLLNDERHDQAEALAEELLEGDKKDPEAWIGVDLDGTLAKYNGYKGATRIGEPIPRMVRRVRRWVSHGKKVKIFTARADDEKSVNAIKKWLKDHDLPDLEITNLKDHHCTAFWDDRAVSVEKNTGKTK